MMNLELTYYGMIAEHTGRTQEPLAVDTPTVQAVREALLVKHPGLRSQTFKIAVNHAFTEADATIPAGAEVAILPPFSGG